MYVSGRAEDLQNRCGAHLFRATPKFLSATYNFWLLGEKGVAIKVGETPPCTLLISVVRFEFHNTHRELELKSNRARAR